jgi:hypothetical protein
MSALTFLESTLPQFHESVSKQTTLTALKSTLTAARTPHTKQRTSNPAESTLTQNEVVTLVESTLAKKGGGGYRHPSLLDRPFL